MTNVKQLTIIGSVFLLTLMGNLQAQPLSLNPDLQFNGKPLEAIAVGRISMGDSSRKDPVDLKQYTPEIQQIIIQESLDKPAEGKIGYSFKYKAYDLDTQNPSYDVYKAIADLGNHQYLMLVESSGGGSGKFTNLLIMSRTGDFIQNVKEIAGGDRANGGIVSVDYQTDLLTVVQEATPFSIFAHALSLTDPNNAILQYNHPDNNLIDSASCRAGKITSTGKLGDKLTPISLILYSESPCDSTNIKPGTLQASYNQIISDYQKKGKTTLTEQEMVVFAQAILDNFKHRNEIVKE